MDPLRVTAIELPARFAEPERALADVDRVLASGATDLVLLPEASLTGYLSDALDADLTRFAEPLEGPTAARLAGLARAHAVYLVGPLVLREENRVHNALVAFGPDGTLRATYRKRHPWYVETWATSGEAPLGAFAIPEKNARVALAICFDVHFLEEESAADLRAADLLLFASAWVEEEDSRPELLSRLARAFDVAVVNANWGPGKPRILGQGGSRIVGRDGALLASARSASGKAVRVDAVVTR